MLFRSASQSPRSRTTARIPRVAFRTRDPPGRCRTRAAPSWETRDVGMVCQRSCHRGGSTLGAPRMKKLGGRTPSNASLKASPSPSTSSLPQPPVLDPHRGAEPCQRRGSRTVASDELADPEHGHLGPGEDVHGAARVASPHPNLVVARCDGRPLSRQVMVCSPARRSTPCPSCRIEHVANGPCRPSEMPTAT